MLDTEFMADEMNGNPGLKIGPFPGETNPADRTMLGEEYSLFQESDG